MTTPQRVRQVRIGWTYLRCRDCLAFVSFRKSYLKSYLTCRLVCAHIQSCVSHTRYMHHDVLSRVSIFMYFVNGTALQSCRCVNNMVVQSSCDRQGPTATPCLVHPFFRLPRSLASHSSFSLRFISSHPFIFFSTALQCNARQRYSSSFGVAAKKSGAVVEIENILRRKIWKKLLEFFTALNCSLRAILINNCLIKIMY